MVNSKIFREIYSDFMGIKDKIVKNQPFPDYLVDVKEEGKILGALKAMGHTESAMSTIYLKLINKKKNSKEDGFFMLTIENRRLEENIKGKIELEVNLALQKISVEEKGKPLLITKKQVYRFKEKEYDELEKAYVEIIAWVAKQLDSEK